MGRLVIDFIAWDTAAWCKLPSRVVVQVAEERLESEEPWSAVRVAMCQRLVQAFSYCSYIEPADCSIGCSTERVAETDPAFGDNPEDTSNSSADRNRRHTVQRLSSPEIRIMT